MDKIWRVLEMEKGGFKSSRDAVTGTFQQAAPVTV